MSQPPVQEVNYKETLNLPVTSFPMKAGAATREPEIEARWEAEKVYEAAQAGRNKEKKFILHDGPPYLSSDKIHIGTALNKILKDIVTRYKYQRGYYSPYVPGYDGHGLPIENAVVKKVKGGRAALTPVELRKQCREFALANLKGQEINFKRLGVWGHWEKPYVTINGEFEAIQIKLFGEMYEKGFVYKGLKPVYWCPTCETALADAEVEYADHESHSIYVAFRLQPESLGKLDETVKGLLTDAAMVIWTTTPWTLPANLALSVHPEFTYTVFETADFGKLIVAKDLLGRFAEATGVAPTQTLGEITGKQLELIAGQHPFIDRKSPVLLGTHVTLDAGTGVVHTAPGHGMEDYVICQQYDQGVLKSSPIGIVSPLNDRGVFRDDSGVSELTGVHYEKANDVVVEILKSKNALLGHGKFTHSYPHCWRCHKPVIYRATEQWFIGVDKFRKEALGAIKSVEWIPARGESRITSMVENRTDWCISRQRVWGVPIPVFYCADENCGTELLTPKIIDGLYEQFKVHTSDIWWEKSAAELLPEGTACPKCNGKNFEKEMDIMDVWFDSGVTHTAVVEARHEELGHLPVELYLEGSDQHRGWFQSALLTSVMVNGKAPYKSVLTHGFVLDEQGRKMSKSLGNVVEPQEIIGQYGADILRLWVASVDYTVDIRIGKNIVAQLAEVYKKTRNTFRFMLGNLHGFNPEIDRVADSELSVMDRYILHRLQHLVKNLTQQFDAYEFHRYAHEIQWFCGNDLSAFYFDVTKDILYCDAKTSVRRRAIQTVLYELLTGMLPLLVPIMPHMADDIWQNLPPEQRPKQSGPNQGAILPSATLLDWPSVKPQYEDADFAADFEGLLKLKEQVNLSLEAPRSEGKIKGSLEAAVQVIPQGDAVKKSLASVSPEELAVLFITSQVEILESVPSTPALAEISEAGQGIVRSLPAPGEKCERCWRFQTSVGSIAAHPTLCQRCAEAL